MKHWIGSYKMVEDKVRKIDYFGSDEETEDNVIDFYDLYNIDGLGEVEWFEIKEVK